MPRRLWIPIGAAAAVVVLGAGVAYAYFFSGLRTTPAALSLSSPSAPSPAITSPSATGSSAAGSHTWTIASGSIVGYRVNEQFVGQSSSHQAVARTSQVTGQVVITGSGGTFEMTSAVITVQLSGLASVDQVAGYNVTNRDRIVQQALDVRSYPTAVFVAQQVTIPTGAGGGQTVSTSVPGRLTIHGVTRSVTADLQLRVTGGSAQIAGTIATTMSNFGVSPPSIGFTTVQPGVTIEFSLDLTEVA